MAYAFNNKLFVLKFLLCCSFLLQWCGTKAQVLEWQLVNPVFDATDPDGGGPATGSVTFTMQVHAVSASVANVSAISAGWSWQSANAMLPATPGPAATCGINSIAPPGNITMSPAFSSLGFTYNNVDQCSAVTNFTTGAQTFDRRTSGTIDGGTITITNAWTDVLTVTLWTLQNTTPQGGYTIINSSSGSAQPDAFATYAVSDVNASEYVVNSMTFGTPLPLPAAFLPVNYTAFNVQCQPDKSTTVSWTTSQEINSSYFELQKSTNGTDWISTAKIAAAGNSNTPIDYTVNDKKGGAVFYRVKQVDKDGNIRYSTQIKTSCEVSQYSSALYPNPAVETITLIINADRAMATNLHVYDSKGMLVLSKEIKISNGTNQYPIDVHRLAAGTYIISSSNSGVVLNKRFTVIH